ncbi:D-glycerate dehydrogenase [Pseudohalioglobus sediminis]|uniref:D-glycerate dehydrogenase n=1 Tax=Pseudohalioglobus sediminis TaxID=2606449 RepID=A0A5B0X1F8_9GAMM|nr:D-glycerate dehydrogenase [Pseudohalioglobus sediminis]KAA1193102.1 D-glycerate dehydrogenase [Pseudohalioglobus sediminis]
MPQSRPVIVLSRPLPDMFTAALEQLGEVRVGPADLAGARIYLAAGVDSVPAELIERFPPELGLIANIATGIDNIDLPAASARGIAVSNTPVVTEDTADLAMALLLATCRKLSASERALRAGDWGAGAGMLGTRVHGKTLGIVGMGGIGQALARRARAFNMTVLYHGPRRKPEADSALDATYCEVLEDMLTQADVVSLNCPLTSHTRHLLNASTLAAMKPGAVLINTGRGALVDEAALVSSLAQGHLGGAGLDVFEFEPRVTEALFDFDNVTLLPHIGSATAECRTDMAMRAYANIERFLETGSPLDSCT